MLSDCLQWKLPPSLECLREPALKYGITLSCESVADYAAVLSHKHRAELLEVARTLGDIETGACAAAWMEACEDQYNISYRAPVRRMRNLVACLDCNGYNWVFGDQMALEKTWRDLVSYDSAAPQSSSSSRYRDLYVDAPDTFPSPLASIQDLGAAALQREGRVRERAIALLDRRPSEERWEGKLIAVQLLRCVGTCADVEDAEICYVSATRHIVGWSLVARSRCSARDVEFGTYAEMADLHARARELIAVLNSV